jgi:hypothetical protein
MIPEKIEIDSIAATDESLPIIETNATIQTAYIPIKNIFLFMTKSKHESYKQTNY